MVENFLYFFYLHVYGFDVCCVVSRISSKFGMLQKMPRKLWIVSRS